MRIPITMCHGTNWGPCFAPSPHWRDSNPYRLPSMDLEHLLFEHEAFRRYLEASASG